MSENDEMRPECKTKFENISDALEEIKEGIKTLRTIIIGNGDAGDSLMVRFALIEKELKNSRRRWNWWGFILQNVIVAVIVAAIFYFFKFKQ
ncbi:MAG: hypothetical protein DRN20_06495 [Thermoplasmata archaeon]|nr:MAG: hypothetical protein DRN20_06495 [Thermoplasmata archaeon]